MENQMVSVERVLDYCKVPQEASLESEKDNKPSNHWPEKGNIEVHRKNRAIFVLIALSPPTSRTDALFAVDHFFTGRCGDMCTKWCS